MIIDLHSHSTASDGTLSPSDLIQRAIDFRVDCFALTDHDTVAGIEEAENASKELHFVPGIEISVSWQGKTLHILGLMIDAKNRQLLALTNEIQDIRNKRAKEMALELGKSCDLPDIWDDLSTQFQSGVITRSHLADYLIKHQICSNKQSVFNNYLVPGKPGFVDVKWVTVKRALDCIHQAGGVAVLAHPAEYKLSSLQMNNLLAELKQNNCEGMEVINGNTAKSDLSRNSYFCKKFDMHASMGSDFHRPDSWVEF